MSDPLKITKIEFDKPIIIGENEKLFISFQNKPDGVVCHCVHVDSNGIQSIVGENVEEVVPNDDQSGTSGEAEEARG